MSHIYKFIVVEKHLDRFHHVNNAMYLTLYEEARWDLISSNGYGMEKIQSTQLGPVVLEVNISFLKELKLHDEVIIETKLLSYDNKIGRLQQIMTRSGELCSRAEFVFGLFDLQRRQLVLPTEDWLKSIGYSRHV